MPTTSTSIESDSPYDMRNGDVLSSKATIIGVSVSFGLFFIVVVLLFLCAWCVRRRNPCVIEKSEVQQVGMQSGERDEERGIEMVVRGKQVQDKVESSAKKMEQETHHKNWWSSPRLSRRGYSELR